MKLESSMTAGLLLALASGGCMAEGPFPSLAQRDVERQPLGEPIRALPQVADDASLRTRIDELVSAAREGDRSFEAAFAVAEASARAAGPGGSDSWVGAQERLSRAETARAATTRSLADLDRLRLERSTLPTSPADQASLEAAMAEIERLAIGQRSRLERLRGLIAR